MDVFFDYLKYFIYISPLYFFIVSYLLANKKVKPSKYTGYSAKAQLISGVAFSFMALGVNFMNNNSVLSLAFMVLYCTILILASKIEKKHKVSGQ